MPKLGRQKADPLIKENASSVSTVKEVPTDDRKPKRATENTGIINKGSEKRRMLQANGDEKPSKHHKKKAAETSIPETQKYVLFSLQWLDPFSSELSLFSKCT